MQTFELAPPRPCIEAITSFLTDAELRRIAEPLRQPAAITRWFQRAGFEVKRKPNGMPLVSRVHFEQVMRGRESAGVGENGGAEVAAPNAAALLQRFAQKRNRKGVLNGPETKEQ